MSDWLEFFKLTGFGAGAGGAVVAVITAIAERRKRKAEAGQIDAKIQLTLVDAAGNVAETAENVVSMLREELKRYQTQNEEDRRRHKLETESLRYRIDQLEKNDKVQRRAYEQLSERYRILEQKNIELKAEHAALVKRYEAIAGRGNDNDGGVPDEPESGKSDEV